MLLTEATFVVLDTETTGLHPDTGRLIEVGAVKARHKDVLDKFTCLINPMRGIPRYVTRLTGISGNLVAHAHTAEQALPPLVEFLSGAVLVMHNERFDLGFLKAEMERAGMEPLNNDTVCTIRLARRVLSGLRSRSLRSLVAYYGIERTIAHRALPDAMATLHVFWHLLKRLAAEHNVNTVEELLRFQRRRYSSTGDLPRHVTLLRETTLPAVPKTPGVYFMRDSRGRLLYIGKASVLARRVRSYFTGIPGKDPTTRRLVQSVREVTWTETRTELAAILLEHRLRKELVPPFNRADKGASKRRFSAPPFLRIGKGTADRRLTVVRHIQDDGARYYGPFRTVRQAETIVKAVFEVYGEHSAHAAQNHLASLRSSHLGGRLVPAGPMEACAFLEQGSPELEAELETLMKAAAQATHFERAAKIRDWMLKLSSLERKRFVTGQSVYDRNAVIVVPRGGTWEVHLVRHGLPVEELAAASPLKEDDIPPLKTELMRLLAAPHVRPARYSVPESDAIRLLAMWLHRHRQIARVIAWDQDVNPEEVATSVLDTMKEDAAPAPSLLQN